MSELPSHRLKQAKRALRREVLAVRDALPPEDRRARSEAIAPRFLALPEVADAGTVMAFWSFGSEVDTAPLIERLLADGRTTAMPRIEGTHVVPVAYRPGDEVRETSFGAFEPLEGRVLDATDLDLVVVPGVAFDDAGRRVGYGGGFYDRLLPGLRPGVPAIALAFSVQLVPEVPTGGMDSRVDAIVTEGKVIRCR
jgi:5-formyltetrahydrofolate cyclo-ligase